MDKAALVILLQILVCLSSACTQTFSTLVTHFDSGSPVENADGATMAVDETANLVYVATKKPAVLKL